MNPISILLVLCIGSIGCVNSQRAVTQFQLLNSGSTLKNTYQMIHDAKTTYCKLNTGNQEILFTIPKSEGPIDVHELTNARCFAVHNKGAACSEGNFKAKSGFIHMIPNDGEMNVSLKMHSVKSEISLKTLKDLKRLLKAKGGDTCTWSYSGSMRPMKQLQLKK